MFGVRIIVRVIVRVTSFRDSFSVLLHRPPTSDHKSSRMLTSASKTPVTY